MSASAAKATATGHGAGRARAMRSHDHERDGQRAEELQAERAARVRRQVQERVGEEFVGRARAGEGERQRIAHRQRVRGGDEPSERQMPAEIEVGELVRGRDDDAGDEAERSERTRYRARGAWSAFRRLARQLAAATTATAAATTTATLGRRRLGGGGGDGAAAASCRPAADDRRRLRASADASARSRRRPRLRRSDA